MNRSSFRLPVRPLRVLVGCERSGVVRRAFRDLGHDAWSCDILPADDSQDFHFQCDVLDIIDWDWDIGIFHPPCTRTAVSGARWFKFYPDEQRDAIDFFINCAENSIPSSVIEHPVSVLSTVYRKPDQIVQPWMFGHGETKATCLWLKNLPSLVPTDIVPGRTARIHSLPASHDRSRIRSLTYTGIADAMALQWGGSQCIQ